MYVVRFDSTPERIQAGQDLQDALLLTHQNDLQLIEYYYNENHTYESIQDMKY